MKMLDLSMPVHERMPVFPGDPAPSFTTATHNGITCSEVSLSLHSGTHVDAPLHVFPQGAGAAGGFISGPACVVAVNEPSVTLDIVRSWPLRRRDRVLVKSSRPHCRIELPAARELVDVHRILLLGLGFLSPDDIQDTGLPVHRFLLENGVILVENLFLDAALPGRYHLHLGWPSFPGREAAWVKAVLTW